MKKTILLVIAVVMVMSLMMGALNLTRLLIINNTKYQIYAKGMSAENPNNRWSYTIDPGDEVVLSIVTEPYWVQVQAREVKVSFVDNRKTYGDWYLCYGAADEFYWDDNKAARLMSFGRGQRRLIIRPDNCKDIPDQMYIDWQALAEKIFEYGKDLFLYDY